MNPRLASGPPSLSHLGTLTCTHELRPCWSWLRHSRPNVSRETAKPIDGRRSRQRAPRPADGTPERERIETLIESLLEAPIRGEWARAS